MCYVAPRMSKQQTHKMPGAGVDLLNFSPWVICELCGGDSPSDLGGRPFLAQAEHKLERQGQSACEHAAP